MKRFLMTAALLVMSVPAFAQTMPTIAGASDPKNAAALQSMGPQLCETLRMLNDPATAEALPPRIDVPVAAADLKQYGASDVTGGQSMTVSFVKGGHVLVNNQDITPAVQSLCAAHGGTTGAPTTTPSTSNLPGQ